MGWLGRVLKGVTGAGLIGVALPAAAQPEAVDLRLVLAVDISASMSFAEQKIQRQGYATALRDPDVISAIQAGSLGRIAITYVEWGDSEYTVIPWSLVDGAGTAEVFAAKLERRPFHRETGTSISRALFYASALFDRGRFTSDRRTIDISGDGPNNKGPPVASMRDTVVAKGIAINGLPIVSERNDSDAVDLDVYYRACVIGGPGAFTIPVRSTNELGAAIWMKLLREIPVAGERAPVIRVAIEQAPSVCSEASALEINDDPG